MRVEAMEADKVEMDKRSNETQNLFVLVGALCCARSPRAIRLGGGRPGLQLRTGLRAWRGRWRSSRYNRSGRR